MIRQRRDLPTALPARSQWAITIAVILICSFGQGWAADLRAQRIEVAGAIRARFIGEGAIVTGITEANDFFFIDPGATTCVTLIPTGARSYDPMGGLLNRRDWLVDEKHDLACLLDCSSRTLEVIRLSSREQKAIRISAGIKRAYGIMPSGEILLSEEDRWRGRSVTPLRKLKLLAGEDYRFTDIALLKKEIVAGPAGPSMTYVRTDGERFEVVRLLPKHSTIGSARLDQKRGVAKYYLSRFGDQLGVVEGAELTFYDIGKKLKRGNAIDLSERMAGLKSRPIALPPVIQQLRASVPDIMTELERRLHEAPVFGICFSGTGGTAAVTLATGELLMLDSQTGDMIGTLDSGPEASGWTEFDPTGLYLGRAGYKHGVEVWSVRTKSIVATVPFTSEGLRDPAGAFSADGSKLLAVEPGIAVHILEGWRE